MLALTAPAPARPTDDLAALIAETPPGAVLQLPRDRVFHLSAPVNITRSITIEGNGARVVAADGAAVAGALIRSIGVTGVQLSNLLVDANVDHSGADYGIWITGGEGHRIAAVTIRNTGQACLYLEDAGGTIEGNRLEGCGRALTIAKGTAANDHGIMVAALTRAVRSVVIRGNTVSGVWRKGITTYARGSGSLSDITIANNRVTGCGLGGIYVASAPGASAQRNITVTGNVVERSYVNFQIDDTVGLFMTDNRATLSRDRDGKPGAEGLILMGVDGATVTGLLVEGSGSNGVLVRNSAHVRLVAPVIVDANSGGNAFGAGLHFFNTRDSRAEDVSIVDDRARPLTTHGVVESDGSRGNVVTVRRIDGVARRLLTVPLR